MELVSNASDEGVSVGPEEPTIDELLGLGPGLEPENAPDSATQEFFEPGGAEPDSKLQGMPLPPAACLQAAATLLKARHANFFKSHQLAGCDWMLQTLLATGGCLLADSMGMGKTFQAAVLAGIFVLADPSFLVRIVCPAAVVDQWRAELQHVFGFHPPAVKILSMDSQQPATACGLLILDEVHLIKNKKSKRFKRFLAWPCTLRLGLTGTQNDLSEFLSIASLLRPDQEMPAVSLSVIRDAREPGATLEKKNEAETQLSALQAFTADFMLQREMDARDLPCKSTNLVFLPLPDNLRMQYRTALDEMASANAPSSSIETLEHLNKVLCSTVDGNPKLLILLCAFFPSLGLQTSFPVFATYLLNPKPYTY